MTFDTFMAAVESYYGKYENDGQKAIVMKYLMSRVKEEELSGLYKNIILNISNNYKTPPSVADIEKLITGNIDALAERAWLQVVNVSDADSILCLDVTQQETIVSMGGWYNFCQYRDQNNTFCHRDFVNRYKMLFKSEQANKVLRGYHDTFWNSEVDYRKVKIIGDIQRGREILIGIMQQGAVDYRAGEVKKIEDVMKCIEIRGAGE